MNFYAKSLERIYDDLLQRVLYGDRIIIMKTLKYQKVAKGGWLMKRKFSFLERLKKISESGKEKDTRDIKNEQDWYAKNNMKKLQEFDPDCEFFPSEKSSWEEIKKSVEDIEVYCDYYDFDILVEHVILTGHSKDFIEYVYQMKGNYPGVKTFILYGRILYPIDLFIEDGIC